MILIVVGHSNPPFKGFLYLFHVAIFFFVSGYLFNVKYLAQPTVFLINRCKRLYVPFVTYGIFFLLFHNVFFDYNIYNENVLLNGFSLRKYTGYDYFMSLAHLLIFNKNEQLLGGFWFLKCLFLVSILYFSIFYVLKTSFKQNTLLYLTIVSFIFLATGSVHITNNADFPVSLTRVLLVCFIYNLGFAYKNYERLIPINIFFFIVSFLILLKSAQLGKIDISRNYYPNFVFFVLNTFAGIYFVVFLSKRILFRIKPLLAKVGENSIHILALHFVCFKVISIVYVLYYDLPFSLIAQFPVINGSKNLWVAYSLVGVLLPLFLVFLAKKMAKLYQFGFNRLRLL